MLHTNNNQMTITNSSQQLNNKYRQENDTLNRKLSTDRLAEKARKVVSSYDLELKKKKIDNLNNFEEEDEDDLGNLEKEVEM
jgi:hypothetical protein